MSGPDRAISQVCLCVCVSVSGDVAVSWKFAWSLHIAVHSIEPFALKADLWFLSQLVTW